MNTYRLLSLALLAGLLPAPAALAQDHAHTIIVNDDSGPHRAFALVRGTDVMVNGYWKQDDVLDRYAHAHPGHYIVFVQEGQLRRLDNTARVAEAEQAYAPMIPLSQRQKELSAEQQPLAAQQKVLAEQQRAAKGNPEEQGRIGAEQGRVGEQQGAIGGKQGELGRQQGEIGRAFYTKVQGMLSACLSDGSCPQVASDTAQR